MISTLYLSRTGMLEPLGQSQVLSYLRGLSRDYSITLISFERPSDEDDLEQLEKINNFCSAHGIRWVRKRYRQYPRVFASALNLLSLMFHCYREAQNTQARLVHARSYIPAAAGWVVYKLCGIPYIFDMRSLWPEELITSKRLKRNSLLHKLIFRAERQLLADSAAIVSLTHAAVKYLEKAHPGISFLNKVCVIPTCADLERFSPSEKFSTDPIVIGCHGSLTNGWFRVDLLGQIFERLALRIPSARFEIITRDNPAKVLNDLGSRGTDSYKKRLTIFAAHSSKIHLALQNHGLSTFFYSSGEASELGRSPTRMGEALGCGIPILTNYGIGDVANTVLENNVGVILNGDGAAELDEAVESITALLADPDLAARCRKVAEDIYSLEAGTRLYANLYESLTAGCQ